MRIHYIVALACVGLSACGTTTQVEESTFVEPNDLMAQEIDERIAQIPYQQREELFNNLVWLSQAGEQAIPSLLQALTADNPKVRSNSLWVLGRMRDRRTIPAMQSLAQDADETVRLEAARSLVTLGDLKHVPILVNGLDSDKVQVRFMCHAALTDATGRNFGYDHLNSDITARQEAAYRWRKWWADQSGDPWFAKDYAADRNLDVFAAENWGTAPSAPMGETDSMGSGGDDLPDANSTDGAQGSMPPSGGAGASGGDGAAMPTPGSGAAIGTQPIGSGRGN